MNFGFNDFLFQPQTGSFGYLAEDPNLRDFIYQKVSTPNGFLRLFSLEVKLVIPSE